MNNNASYLALIFIGVLMVGLLVMLIIVFVNKKNAIIDRKQKDEANYNKRITSSELKALRSQMNPHFIHNSLNSIQYYIQQHDVESSEMYLNKFSNLIRMFFELSRKKEILLSEEVELLEHYLSIEKLRFEEKLNFNIKIQEGLNPNAVKIPSMLLQPIVENAVNHGIFHKSSPGWIEIEFGLNENGYVLVRIEDDGIGINKALAMKAAKNTKKESHSSDVLRDRLLLLHESSEFDIDMEQYDKSEVSADTGTVVNLEIRQSEHRREQS